MALTRAQYLQGDSGQGNVLLGQVQGVKQGPGTLIASDGTISVNAATVVGLVKLNNLAAFNSYVWPNTSGSIAQFLMTDGSGNLSWQTPMMAPTVFVSPTAPTSPGVGQLWFDCTQRILKVYENCSGASMWTPVSKGNDAQVINTTASPPFVVNSADPGDGSEEEPFRLTTVNTLTGGFVRFPQVITITGFAPYQYVPITDLNADINGNRFSVTSNFTDGDGVLTFCVMFMDFPATSSGIGYTALLEVGFSSVFISAPVNTTIPLTLSSAGSISGAAEVGKVLTYSRGQAAGGVSPYTYTWEWRRASDQTVIQTNGNTLTIPSSLDGDRVFVQLRATDANKTTVTGSTGNYPTSPALIFKNVPPQTNILFPTALEQEVATTWLDAGTTLQANGCIEITTDGSTWGQGPFPILNGGVVKTRWIDSPTCGDAPQNTTISGCVFNTVYQKCGSLTIDRIPAPFSFLPANNIQLNSVATSNAVTPTGYNAWGFVTYQGISTLTNIQGSLDNGVSWVNIPPAGTNTFLIKPGQTLTVRGTVGGLSNTAYNAVINVGLNESVQTGTFTATTTAQTSFTTLIRFPTTTSQGYSITQPGGSAVAIPGAASDSWVDGNTSLTATGCVEIQIENSGGTVLSAWGAGPFPIVNSNIVRTRWKTTSVCGTATHGANITGTVTNVPSGGSKTADGMIMIDRVVNIYQFTDLTGQALSTQITSNIVSITGNNATTYLTATGTLTSLQASVNGGAWTSIPTSGTSFAIQPVAPGTTPPTLQVRGTTGAVNNTEYSANLTIGDGGTAVTNDPWRVTTTAAVKTVLTPSILTPTNGSTNINPNTLNPSGVNVTASAYAVTNGASATQLNAEWEVREGSDTGTVVYSLTKTSAFNTLFIPLVNGSTTILDPGTDYFVRVRYTSADSPAVVSAWSPFSQFETSPVFAQQWALRDSTYNYFGYNYINNNGSRWIAVDSYGRTVYSDDAISWKQGGTLGSVVIGIFLEVNALAYGNNLWLTVGDKGALTAYTSSNNGISWSLPTNTGITSNKLYSVAFGAGVFVAVGNTGTIQTTTNGSAWTTRTSGTTARLTSIIWDGTKFVAVGDGVVLTSTTGTTWTSVAMPSVPNPQIAYLAGPTPRYLVVSSVSTRPGGISGTATPYVSTNLTSWTSTTIPTPSVGVIAAGNGVFTAGSWDSTNQRLDVYTSPTGLTGTWDRQTSFPVSRSYYHTHYLSYGTTSTGLGRYVLIDHEFNIFSTN